MEGVYDLLHVVSLIVQFIEYWTLTPLLLTTVLGNSHSITIGFCTQCFILKFNVQ